MPGGLPERAALPVFALRKGRECIASVALSSCRTAAEVRSLEWPGGHSFFAAASKPRVPVSAKLACEARGAGSKAGALSLKAAKAARQRPLIRASPSHSAREGPLAHCAKALGSKAAEAGMSLQSELIAAEPAHGRGCKSRASERAASAKSSKMRQRGRAYPSARPCHAPKMAAEPSAAEMPSSKSAEPATSKTAHPAGAHLRTAKNKRGYCEAHWSDCG